MLDEQIVALFWERSEDAIAETSKKYGNYCFTVAHNILQNAEDAQECVNDAYLNAWNSMPPHRPNRLATFLGKITRNLALTKWTYYSAQKRSGTRAAAALEELEACVSGEACTEAVIDKLMYEDLINRFLGELSDLNRDIFVSRYWHLYTVAEIAKRYHISESRVKVALFRMRGALKQLLEKEGVY